MSGPILSRSMKLVGLCAVLALPLSAQAGEITRPDSLSKYQWKSTECFRPLPAPALPGASKQDRLMRYAHDIEVYIDCIKTEAQRDFEKAQRELQAAIEQDLEKQTDIMNSKMLRAAKTMR